MIFVVESSFGARNQRTGGNQLIGTNDNSIMTSFKRFGSKPVVKYAYIGISADRQRHNLLWLFKYRICPIRMEIIHGGLNIY